MADTNPSPAPDPNPFAPTQQVTTSTTLDGTAAVTQPLYAPGGPDPQGTTPAAASEQEQGNASARSGEGIEGEEVIWEASYSMRNFVGRIVWRVLATLAWLVLASETWVVEGHGDLAPVTITLGIVLLAVWGALIFRMLQARYGHYYRLTNRRLFVSTGVMRRQRDQMELLRVKDVNTRQRMSDRWLSLGTVVVTSHDKEIFHLVGVDDPKGVMDLVWHHARAERDNRSTKIDSI